MRLAPVVDDVDQVDDDDVSQGVVAQASDMVLAVDATGAAKLFGISARTWGRMDRAGECPEPVSLRGCRRWSLSTLRKWDAAGYPDRVRFVALNGS